MEVGIVGDVRNDGRFAFVNTAARDPFKESDFVGGVVEIFGFTSDLHEIIGESADLFAFRQW